MVARLSRFQFSYTFNLTPCQKFIRLHFYETSYQNLDRSKAFFSVKVGSFTLLSNFSTSLASNFSDQEIILKELCVDVQENQILNITFTPSQDYRDSYAFINGIEIVSMLLNLYYTTATGDTDYPFMGQTAGSLYSLSNSNALETVHRVNVGRNFISAREDTGMYRTWSDDISYLTEAISALFLLTLLFNPVLAGLHFCEFQQEITVIGNRIFEIYIANQMAEKGADVIGWGDGSGVLVYMDYAVTMGSKSNQKKQNLSIALCPTPTYMTNYSDAILNGVEIFKVDSSGSLAEPNPNPWTNPTMVAPPTPGNNHSNNRKILIVVVAGVVSSFIAVSVVLLFIRR
ncbi:hypothetical protein EZV62_015509 [Acer yangbiense]|uniref:Malectin-like domain-containing protein n=1 Tax=Acer yangbiense TaxID=1000413 RepID=A0A5C7HKY8_9ROSI|nr:hypothetical protein EZV62_015509 [Acer yangbiense]